MVGLLNLKGINPEEMYAEKMRKRGHDVIGSGKVIPLMPWPEPPKEENEMSEGRNEITQFVDDITCSAEAIGKVIQTLSDLLKPIMVERQTSGEVSLSAGAQATCPLGKKLQGISLNLRYNRYKIETMLDDIASI